MMTVKMNNKLIVDSFIDTVKKKEGDQNAYAYSTGYLASALTSILDADDPCPDADMSVSRLVAIVRAIDRVRCDLIETSLKMSMESN